MFIHSTILVCVRHVSVKPVHSSYILPKLCFKCEPLRISLRNRKPSFTYMLEQWCKSYVIVAGCMWPTKWQVNMH